MTDQNLGRYQIIEELGRGGMATVFHAHDPRFKRDVAIKVLPREFLHDPTFSARFEREAQIIAALEHPSIVPVYDYGEEDGQPYLVMRFMSGGALSDRIEKGRLSVDEAASILGRIGPALDYAHSQKVIHRDLKPANILFDSTESPYLADFGIARLTEATSALTGTSGVIGTPAYMSPEQVHGEKDLDGRSDIYALGVVLFEMLTGERPYQAETPAKLMMKHVLEPVPSARKVKPELAPQCETIITHALAKERDERYATATSMASDLEALRGDKPATQEKISRHAPGVRAVMSETITEDEPVEGETVVETPLTEIESFSNAAPSRPASPSRKGLPRWVIALGGLMALGLFAVLAVFASGFPPDNIGTEGEQPEAPTVEGRIENPTNPPATEAVAGSIEVSSDLTPIVAPEAEFVDDSEVPMILIPGGPFDMGSDRGQAFPDYPSHTIVLSDFYIDQHEVTNKNYAKCVAEFACSPPQSTRSFTRDKYYGDPQYKDYPVINVNWDDAQTYCEWRGGRLPTEAEWEKAARGTEGRTFPWGDTFTAENLNFCDTNCPAETSNPAYDDGFADTAPVGSFSSGASPYGALDMAGNVWEWVGDWFDRDFYSVSAPENPTGPTSGEERVVRGGSFFYPDTFATTTSRVGMNPESYYGFTGMRCVYDTSQ